MPLTPTPFTEDQLTRFAQAVVGALSVPMVIVDQQQRVLAASPPFLELLATTEDPRGQDLLSLDGGDWDVAGLRQALAKVLPHEKSFENFEVPGPGYTTLFVNARAVHIGEGKPELVALSFEQLPAAARSTTDLSEEHLAIEVVATIREPLLVLDYDHRVVLANQSFYRVFRVSQDDVLGRHLTELGNGQWNIPEVRKQLDMILRRDRFFNDFEVEHDFHEIGRRIMLLNAKRVDHLRLILLAMEDVTERRRHESQQQMLVSELAHRVQNLLAVVQSLTSHTRAESVEGFRAALTGRLKALGMAHGVLFESRWHKAELEGMLRQILAPFMEETLERVRLDGPQVNLTTDEVTGLALIVNELATNAAKHGALSGASGQVAISWAVVSDQLCIEWEESKGPAVQPSPTASFGTSLIERTASYQLRGQVELKFEPTGLVCKLAFPLAD